jgi:hypothetical protein
LEKDRKSLRLRIDKYEKDIAKYKEYDQKKNKRHHSELNKADTLLKYVAAGYKKNLDLIERILDNAIMHQEMDISEELRPFQDKEEQNLIKGILNFFEEKYAKKKKNLFINIKKR